MTTAATACSAFDAPCLVAGDFSGDALKDINRVYALGFAEVVYELLAQQEQRVQQSLSAISAAWRIQRHELDGNLGQGHGGDMLDRQDHRVTNVGPKRARQPISLADEGGV
jgi:hypothetical protein